MYREKANDLYQIVEIAETHDQKREFDLETIKPYLNDYIHVRVVPKDGYITREEDELRRVYYVIHGTYYIMQMSAQGKENIKARRNAPQFIGVEKTIDKHVTHATNKALKECIVLEINQRYFIDCLKMNGEFGLIVIKSIIEKLMNASEREERLLFHTSKEHLLYYINKYWNDSHTNSGICRIEEKNSRIIDEIGISMRTLHRLLRQLKEEGLISVEKGNIVVTEEQVLKIRECLPD